MFGAFLLVDVGFFSANLVKIVEGGWFSARVRARGVRADVDVEARPRALSRAHRRRLDSAAGLRAKRIAGMHDRSRDRRLHDRQPDVVPHALLHSIKHYKSLHERVVLLTAITLDVPHVPPAQRVTVESINAQFHKVKVFFGFMDEPDLPDVLEWCAEQGLRLDLMDTSFFLGARRWSRPWARHGAVAREAVRRDVPQRGQHGELFNLPPNRVVELGSQVAL
jgi:KUP system potassium uptake protein